MQRSKSAPNMGYYDLVDDIRKNYNKAREKVAELSSIDPDNITFKDIREGVAKFIDEDEDIPPGVEAIQKQVDKISDDLKSKATKVVKDVTNFITGNDNDDESSDDDLPPMAWTVGDIRDGVVKFLKSDRDLIKNKITSYVKNNLDVNDIVNNVTEQALKNINIDKLIADNISIKRILNFYWEKNKETIKTNMFIAGIFLVIFLTIVSNLF